MSEFQATAVLPRPAGVVVTLIDGTAVDSNDRRWLAETQQRLKHMQNMQRMDRVMRGTYLSTVERAEGLEAARRLAKAYVADWEQRKSQLRAFEPSDTRYA